MRAPELGDLQMDLEEQWRVQFNAVPYPEREPHEDDLRFASSWRKSKGAIAIFRDTPPPQRFVLSPDARSQLLRWLGERATTQLLVEIQGIVTSVLHTEKSPYDWWLQIEEQEKRARALAKLKSVGKAAARLGDSIQDLAESRYPLDVKLGAQALQEAKEVAKQFPVPVQYIWLLKGGGQYGPFPTTQQIIDWTRQLQDLCVELTTSSKGRGRPRENHRLQVAELIADCLRANGFDVSGNPAGVLGQIMPIIWEDAGLPAISDPRKIIKMAGKRPRDFEDLL